MHVQAHHYVTGVLVEIRWERGVIQSVTPLPASSVSSSSVHPWVAPALFDLQINGCDGHSFNSERLAIADVRHIVQVCGRHGIGALCPTLVTNSLPALRHGLSTLRQACG